MRKIFPALTGLRLVAAVSVVLAHCIALVVKVPDPTRAMAYAGAMAECGMSLFFILSGFVIHSNYSGRVGSRVEIWNFFVARFARLYPLFFVFLCFDLLMKVGFHQTNIVRLQSLPYYVSLTHSWLYSPNDGNALIFQYGLVPQVTWSISTEWFFYIIFPLVCLPMAALRTPRSLLISILSLCAFALLVVSVLNYKSAGIERVAVSHFGAIAANPQDGFFRWLAYFSPYVRSLEFVLGCFVSATIGALRPPAQSEQRFGSYCTVISVLAACGLVYVFAQETTPKAISALSFNFGFAPVLALVIFCCARYENAVVRILSAPYIILAGEASYSIYLSHMMIFGAFRYEVATVTDPQIWIATILQCAAALVAVIGSSLVLWALIEVPSRRALRRWLEISPRPVLTGTEKISFSLAAES